MVRGRRTVAGRAQAAEAAGHALTAASNYLRACFYYQIADHFRQPKDEDALSAYRVSLECFRKYAALTERPRIETVELPFEGGAFPAYFIHGEGNEARKPCVVRFGGFDTQKEIQYLRGTTEIVRRGFSVLLVDGPGQGESIRFRGMRMRHDFEVAGSAALDFLEKRDDVDMDRVAIIAMSLGGYYAPRCAAMDPRYKAAIAWGAIWDYYELWRKRIERLKQAALPVPADHLLWACGVETFGEALKKLEGFRLRGSPRKCSVRSSCFTAKKTRRCRWRMHRRCSIPSDRSTRRSACSVRRKAARSIASAITSRSPSIRCAIGWRRS